MNGSDDVSFGFDFGALGPVFLGLSSWARGPLSVVFWARGPLLLFSWARGPLLLIFWARGPLLLGLKLCVFFGPYH